MYFTRTPEITKIIYPSMVWNISNQKHAVFLTFDDGPDPDVTPLALEMLERFSAKATFFCVGEKVDKYPQLFEEIQSLGHSTGNHTYNHLQGRKTPDSEYIENIEKADNLIGSALFRPPYGKITRKQVKMINNRYTIVMWTILAGDFDRHVSKEKVLKRITRYTKGGNIVVLHDNVKFKEKMLYALEGTLEYFRKRKFKFEAIKQDYFI